MIQSINQNINITDGNASILALNKSNLKISIVASKFNGFVVDCLIKGCIESLNNHGVSSNCLELILVPGAMELPLAVQNIIIKSEISGVVALGAVIRGATPHFDYVAGECMSGLSKLSLKHNKPIGIGVLTTDTVEQAIDRSGCKSGNKGSEAALTVLAMIGLIHKLKAEQ